MGSAFGNLFHDLGAVGKSRQFAATHIALALQSPQRSGLEFALRGVGGREIAAWARAAPAAATSRDNNLEVPARFRRARANMSGIDAPDEFAFWVTRQIQLDLAAFSR